MIRNTVLILVVIGSIFGLSAARGGIADDASTLESQGREALRRGQLLDAAAAFRSAAAKYESSGQVPGQIAALIDLGNTQEAMGNFADAVRQLQTASQLAQGAGDPISHATALCALGSTQTCLRDLDSAGQSLAQAKDLADAVGRPDLQADILNNLGNLAISEGQYSAAAEDYGKAALLADQGAGPQLRARIAVNAAVAAQAAGASDAADRMARAISAASQLDDSREKGFDLLTTAMTAVELADADHNATDRAVLMEQALATLQSARHTAEQIGDPRLLSYALGELGHLYEIDKQNSDALALTRRAEFAAQSLGAQPMYRWEWQAGRILAAQGDLDDAIRACKNAVATLGPIRGDLSLGYGNAAGGMTYRQSVGPLLFELADLILRRTDTLPADQVASSLVEARQTVELLKSSELEDYFKDDCVVAARARIKQIGAVSDRTAVIYFIPLPDRVEVLLQIGQEITRFKLPISAAQLNQKVHEFRAGLEDRTTYRYLTEAATLYDWLIRPMSSQLQAHHVDTLVFVPDGALLAVPMSALYDGQNFLITKYAVAVTPGLTLMDPKPIPRERIQVLAGGLGVSVQGYPALSFVPQEVQDIHNIFGAQTLINGDFNAANLRRDISSQPFSVIHLATHAHFSGDLDDTYLLTFNGKLSLDDLQKLIAPTALPSHGQLRPIELLTLSACETAAGDDRAALGLAGVAIKAGARSAMATLWPVDDQAQTMLMSDFYSRLENDSTMSKARALQLSQLQLMQDPRYRHAFYWSPELIIGNWL
jgi:CHAT domain-containing protein